MPLITLTGYAVDLTDGNISAQIEWSEGGSILATGQSVEVMLGFGSHTIVAKVADSGGNVTEKPVSFSVVDAAPTLTVNAPDDGEVIQG